MLQPFAYDESHAYASGQHRGIDIGADAAGETVVAPAAGIVGFAGTVPTNGKSVTIETPDGYSVTLTHLGSLLVGKGATVAEGGAVGTIGPSGAPEVDGPYVHLGIRVAADPNGYLDPLRFLPAPAGSEPSQSGTQPSTSTATTPASKPASTVSASARGSTTRTSKTRPSHVESRPHPSAQRPAVHAGSRASAHTTRTQRPLSEPKPSTRRWVVEPAAPRPSTHVSQPQPLEREAPSALVALLCNGAAALVALGAALVARRRLGNGPIVGAQILHLPRPISARRAA